MMKKIIFAAAVVAASAFGVMKATDVNNTKNMSELQLADVEALAQGGEQQKNNDSESNGEKAPYYERYKKYDWYGYATGYDGYSHQAHFYEWGCKPGWILDSCTPYTEVIIY